jgi:7 transmembrane receptor (rhodopsin family)
MDGNNTFLGNHSYNGSDLSDKIMRSPWWAMLIIGLLIFLTVVANVLVMVSFLFEPRLRVPFNYYLLNLAVSDLLVGALDMPHYAIYTYYNYWPLSYAQCSFWMFFDYVGPAESLWGLLIISLDRLWAVTFPLSYKKHNSNRKCFFVILASWFISIGVMLPGYIRSRGDYVANDDPNICDWNSDKLPEWASAFYATMLGSWVPVLLAVVSYLVTTFRMWQLKALRKQQATVTIVELQPASATITRGIRSRQRRKDKQAFLMLTLLIVAMIGLWTPWFVVSLHYLLYGFNDDLLYVVSYWLSYALSGLNPFLFNAANDDMRKTFKGIFLRGGGMKPVRSMRDLTGTGG